MSNLLNGSTLMTKIKADLMIDKMSSMVERIYAGKLQAIIDDGSGSSKSETEQKLINQLFKFTLIRQSLAKILDENDDEKINTVSEVKSAKQALQEIIDNTGSDSSSTTPPSTNIYTLSADSANVTEGNSGATTMRFALRLNQPPTEIVTVNITPKGGSAKALEDYTIEAKSLSFSKGQSIAYLDIKILGDTTPENDETLELEISGKQLTQSITVTGIIKNDDKQVTDPASGKNVIAGTVS